MEKQNGEETADAGTQRPEGPSKIEFKAVSCPVSNVTVFLDRAEVNRIVETKIESKEAEVVIKGLPSVIDQNSVRVQCYGPATIIEVQYREEVIKEEAKADVDEKDKESELDMLRKKKKEVEKKRAVVGERWNVYRKEKDLLAGYGDRLLGTNSNVDKVTDTFEKRSVENLTTFLEYFNTHSHKINKTLFDLKDELDVIDKEIEFFDNKMKQLQPKTHNVKSHIDRCMSVLLEAEKPTELKLLFSYVVSHAKWTPLYDLRAFSKDNVLQLLYFGTIHQTTGEDWEEAKIALSTAMPSIGGSPPELATQYLSIDHAPSYSMRKAKRGTSFRKLKRARDSYADPQQLMDFNFSANINEYDPTIEDSYCPPMEEALLPSAEATEGITSTSFEIACPATIKSDNSGHKVSICQIELKPYFEHVTVPKLVAHAFLKARVKNESQYALLAGDSNVFLDNNFLTKSYLEAVSPQEEFEVSLGADPSVKVTYKPLKKFKQTTGVLSKTVQLQFHQEIVLKNTKTRPVKITVTDQLPKSSEEKIKINLIEPVISSKHAKGVTDDQMMIKLTDKNNIDWILTISPGESKEISMRYNVEHPSSVNIKGL